MSKSNKNPFKNLVLDQYEQEIEDYINNNNVVLKKPSPKRLQKLKSAADTTLARLKKTKNVNLRISEDTVNNLKIKAAQFGLRYQTLAGSVLHRYASGQTIVADSL